MIDSLREHPFNDGRMAIEVRKDVVTITMSFRSPAAAQVYFEAVTDLLNSGKDVNLSLMGARRVPRS